MHWTEKEYAYYRGEENVCDGTIHEIAATVGSKVESVKWMTTPTSKNRAMKRDRKNTARLVPIIDESKALMTYKLSDDAIDALSDAAIFTVGDLMMVSDEVFTRLHHNERILTEIARYRDWFVEVEREDDCDEAM